MFTSFVGAFRKNVVEPKVNSKMDEVGKAWVAEASRLCPVDTGFLRSTLGYTYDPQSKVLKLHADAKYSLFVELGTRHIPAHPFMRPALSVVPRVWRGSVGMALTGHSVELQAANVAPKYHAGIAAHAKGRTHGARILVGHGKFK